MVKENAFARRRALWLLAALSCSAACSSTPKPAAGAAESPAAAPLPNGIYGIVGEGAAGTAPPAGPGQRTLLYNPRGADPSVSQPPHDVTIATRDFVPLILAAPPGTIAQPDGRLMLDVSLASDQVQPLEAFSRRHLGERAALLLDDAIISIHKMRAVLTGGHVKISRCSDRACDSILVKLLESIDGGR
jgi:hypothetical protein